MGRVQYGMIITEIKGKVGGQVLQSSNAGFSMKNKGRVSTVGNNADSALGLVRRTAFSSAIKNWSQLSDSDRATWSNIIGTWTFINAFGNAYNGTAYQIQNACNINRQLLGLSMLSAAPSYNAAFDPQISYTDYSVSGVFNGTIANAAANGQLGYVQASSPTTPTKNIGRVRFREFGVITSAVGTVDYKAIYAAWLGFTPPVGSVFYIRIWTAWADYPYQQFKQTFKIKVVA